MERRYPRREIAQILIKDAQTYNPGAWVDHSYVVAQCAEKIAKSCGMDPEKAYVLGLLHDIGRKFGIKHFGHIYDGYKYMERLGYGDVARICLTHSFCIKRVEDYLGNMDVTKEEEKEVTDALNAIEYDDYDLLIQLCDTMGAAEGVVPMEVRMEDVRRRYGKFPQDKWDKNMELRAYFEKKCSKDIYDVVG